MDKTNTLKMSLYQEEWFALENVDMHPVLFAKLVNALEKVFLDEYGVVGSKEHVNKINKNDNLVLFTHQKKVPNIIKSLVHNPSVDIQVSLKGKTNTGEELTRMMVKPFDVNSCTELIPYYNGLNQVKQNTPQQNKPNRR